MNQPKTISYSMLVGDLFHFGHLTMLKTAKQSADYHICGVINQNVVEKWMSPVICTYEERRGVIDKIKYVDETIGQESIDPTINLKLIHKKYPNAKIVLIQNHILGGNSVLGSDFIKNINGDIIHHKFYSKLSTDYIKSRYIKSYSEERENKKFDLNDISISDKDVFQSKFTTKANTISSLRKILNHATIEKEFVFTVKQWKKNKTKIIEEISEIFGKSKIVIRSSSINEDSLDFSNAGHYESVLNVKAENFNNIKIAVEKVIKSYNSRINQNQVLVQKQTEDVIISGVVFTRNLWTNSPYYLINYDDVTCDTTSVTGGKGINKKIEILRDTKNTIISKKWRFLIQAVREIENFFKGITLDIEFAIKKNDEIVIFQVRPLAANSKFYSNDDDDIRKKIYEIQNKLKLLKSHTTVKILSKKIFLSDMAFWNPAELIGDRPNYLDYSLFNHLIMKSNWNKSLIPLGYSKVEENLLKLVSGKPYVNVHHAFLSLLPEKINLILKSKLLDYYNSILEKNPELHDKVEFEIVHNCYRFDFDAEAKELLKKGFSSTEINSLKTNLLLLTRKILKSYKSIIQKDAESIKLLNEKYNLIYNATNKNISWEDKLKQVYILIEDCRALGTEQFSRIARLAFISGSLIKSLEKNNQFTKNEIDGFINSINTVATEIDKSFDELKLNKINTKEFIKKYGHLRPGTYDITKLPYRKKLSYLTVDNNLKESSKDTSPKTYDFSILTKKITEISYEQGVNVKGKDILNFIKSTTELREYFKFIYTKNISLAIELVAEVGNELGFDREELSNLDYHSITACREFCSKDEIINLWRNIINSRKKERKIQNQISLPPIIYTQNDIVEVPSYISLPNFITDSIIESDVIFLEKNYHNNLKGKIVVIEKADPGYDWIFNKEIGALVTKYGGAASHMAIRCAEFQIPAAIGCGDLIFSKILQSAKIMIDCKNKTINTIS